MSPDEHKDRVDWVVPGNGDIKLGADRGQIIEIDKKYGYVLQPTEKDPVTGKTTRARVDRIAVQGMPAPQPVNKK